MPYDPLQLETDVEYLTRLPQWQDEATRPQFIREVALKAGPNLDPQAHGELADALWSRSKGGMIQRGANFVARGAEEVVKSFPAAGAAAAFAVGDATGMTDTGSGTRLKRGVANLLDATGQRAKQLAGGELLGMNLLPGESQQAKRDSTLKALKQSLDQGLYPQGLEQWVTGAFDATDAKPDAETQQWIDLMTRGIAERAVAADHMGEVKPEKVREWLQSDRNPAFADSDIPGEPGPRELLADYLATRDPASWDAFQARVAETDSQRTTRLQRYAAEGEVRAVNAVRPDGLGKDLALRGMDMQTSPIDLATVVLPVFRGSAALKAARAGSAAKQVLKGMAAEAVQEGTTQYLSDPNASTGSVLEAAGLGAVGQGVISAPMAGAGALLKPSTTNQAPGTNDYVSTNQTPAPSGPPQAPGTTPADAPLSMLDIAARAGMVNAPIPRRQAILTGVPDRVPPFRDQPLNQGVPEMAGDVVTDLRIPRSPEAIAESQRIEKERQAKIAQMRMLDARATGMPLIPDSPRGDKDILDFANENPIYLPPGFSLMQFDPQTRGGLLVDEYQPRGPQTFPAESAPQANPDPAQTITGSNEQTGSEMPVPPPTANAGAGAGAVSLDDLNAELQMAGGRFQFSRPVPNFTAAARPALAAASSAVRTGAAPSQTTVAGQAGGNAWQQAYTSAAQGASTQMLPLSSVYAQARLLDPTLTVDRFLTQVQADYNAGRVLLEGAGSQQEAAQAGLSLPGTNVGVAVRMMPAPQYSRQGIAPAVAQRAAADAVKLLAERLPHLTNGKLRTYADAAAFLADAGYHRGQGFTSAELAALEGAEAFYDNLTGSTVVLLNQIGLREGETPIRAVARVLLHERVGHEGVNALLKDSTEAAKWDKLAARIPQAELDGIATEPGYTHLAGDRGQLALEWLARQTERIEGARNAAAIEGGLSGVAKQLWQALKELLGKVFANFSRSAALASEVAEIITRARTAQMVGTALPMTAEAMATRLQMSGSGATGAAMASNSGAAQNAEPSPGGLSEAEASNFPQLFEVVSRALAESSRAAGGTLQMSMNPLHRAGTPFEVSPRRLALRTILTGSPLPRALKEVVMSTDNERKALDASFARIGDLMRVAAEGVAARTGTPLADVYAQVNAYLEGQPGAQAVLMNVDEGLAEASRRARNMLDDMTQAIANTLPNSDLRATMIGNMGSWMRRGYAAFDEASGWNFKAVLAAARAGKQLGGKDAARIMREAAAFLEAQDATLQGQRDATGLPREGTLLHAEMKDLMDRDTWAAAMMGGAGVRKNTSSLMRRKDIPGQLRALMGEESNPLRKYAASGAFQAQFLARHQGQIAMRQLGLSQGLFQTQRGGDFNIEIPKDVKWSGMAGLWTTPELWAALQATSGTDLMGAGAGGMLLQGLYWLSNMAKLNRVALNPKSWAPNIFGGLVSLVQSGDVLDWHFMRRVGDAMRTMQAGKAKASDVRDAAAVGLKDAQRALLSRLQAGGVINSNVMLRDIAASLPQSLMNFIARTDYGDKARGAARGALLGNALARSMGGPLSLTRAAAIAAGAAGGAVVGEQRIQNVEQKIADFVLSGPDNLVKITGWLRNYEVALASGMNAQQAEAQATERTLNTFPNYARLPALAREASRLGVIGSFVAFQVEVLRNYGHNWVLVKQDLLATDAQTVTQQTATGTQTVTIRTPNKALRADAVRRMVGLSSVTALAFGGLSGVLTLMLGSTPPDDERNKKWRKWFAAPWEKDALLHFNSYDENGVSYLNPSYLVPQTTMAELVETLNQGLPPEEAAQRFLGRLWEQYGVGSSVHVSPLLAALTNQNRAGRPITYREGVAGAVERADYAAKVIADPGAASLLTELVYALQSKEVDGKTYTVEQLAKQLAGMRVQTQTWDHLLEMRYKAFSADYQNVRAEARRQIKASTSTPAQAMQWANTEITRLQSEVKAFEADLPQMNIPAPKAKTARKNSRIGTLSPVELTKDGKGLQAD